MLIAKKLWLIYFLYLIVTLKGTAARPYMPSTDTLRNPYARNDNLLEILDEYDYDFDTKKEALSKPVEKPRKANEPVLTTHYSPDTTVAQKKYPNNKMQQNKEEGLAGLESNNDNVRNSPDVADSEETDDAQNAAAATDVASHLIVSDIDPEHEEPSAPNKAIFTKSDRPAKSELFTPAQKQTIAKTQITYYDKTDHLTEEQLDLVLSSLSLQDLRALSDFIDSNVMAERTETFLESNLRAPQHYIIRMNNDANQLRNNYPQEFFINLNLQQPNIKERTQLALKAKRTPATLTYYQANYRKKRQGKSETPTYMVDDEYLKMLAYSFPQDSRQKTSTDNEIASTHLRVKRN